ncbi:uncharacterized protein LOC144105276 [Amblyomma americanum]
MPFDDQRNWVFYRVKERPTFHGFNEALTRMTSALNRLNDDASEVPHAWVVRGSAVYACLLVELIEHYSVGRYAVYVSMWTTQPLFGVTCSCRIPLLIQEVFQFAFGRVTFLFGKIRGSPEVALKRGLSTLSTQSKFSAEPQGQRYPITDQQPRESLAVGFHGEQLTSVPGATADAEQNASEDRGNFPFPECWEDFQSQPELEQHYSHGHQAEMKQQHLRLHCPYWSSSSSQLETHLQSHRAEVSSSSKISSTQPAKETAPREESAFRPLHTCRSCGECFPNGSLLRRHHEQCSAIRHLSCPYCGLFVPD